METIKRKPVFYKLSREQEYWLSHDCCPICGLPKKDWKRRTDFRCCSVICTKKFLEISCFFWQEFREKVLKRDKYKCVKCGITPERFYTDTSSYTEKEIKVFYKDEFIRIENKKFRKVFLIDKSKLIADHITPIAIGGEEYDLDNIQTLCEKCNKIKTKKDLKKIALYRKLPKTQTKLDKFIPPRLRRLKLRRLL